MVKHEYPGLLTETGLAREARDVAARTHEFSQFLVRVLGVTELTSAVPGRVTYHDSCHLLRGLHESQSPRTLLGTLRGAEFVALPGADECCGFGGSFAVRLPEVSSQILAKKLANVEATGAGCLVACDAGCLMQMGGGLKRRKSRVRALHLAELLDGSRL
jgi:L-lactate dehydrogenase complex protein LldE